MRLGADPRTTPTADGARLLARQVPAEERPDTVRHDLAHLSVVECHGPTEGALLNFRADQHHEMVRRALGSWPLAYPHSGDKGPGMEDLSLSAVPTSQGHPRTQ
jgi:hypothetical protein